MKVLVGCEHSGDDRWKKRAQTYQGIADAFADQWGEPWL